MPATLIILGIRVIKFFAWEDSFAKRIMDYRFDEIYQLKVLGIVRSVFFCIFLSTPLFVAMVTFAVYIGTGNVLTPATTFTALGEEIFFTFTRSAYTCSSI